MRAFLACAAACLLGLAGCSGGGSDTEFRRTEVAGVVFDADGEPVRDARVYYDGAGGPRETRSNSAGQYLLEDLPEGDLLIKVEVGNNLAYGQNIARTFARERTKNLNVAVFPAGERGHLTGTVEDRDGFLLAGARVFARPTDGSILTSSYGITDSNGRFNLRDLQADREYELVVNAQGYGTDTDEIVVDDSEVRELRFVLSNAPNPALPPPANLEAQATTSPSEITRDRRAASAAAAMKAILDEQSGRTGRPATTVSRDTAGGNPIEIDLFWDRVDNPGLLGYGIYRGPNSQSLRAVEFVRDPIAEFFADNDRTFVEGQSYTYAMTSLNTRFDETDESESDFSNAATAETLGDLNLRAVPGSLSFGWTPAIGAENYAVYFFDEYPRIGSSAFFNTFNNRTTGTTYDYNGPALQSGRTYYYLVVGFANEDFSRTISRVGEFVAP